MVRRSHRARVRGRRAFKRAWLSRHVGGTKAERGTEAERGSAAVLGPAVLGPAVLGPAVLGPAVLGWVACGGGHP